MSRKIVISPREFPLKPGESWWIVHPNTAGSSFKIPYNAITCCRQNFLEFRQGTLYNVSEGESGWVNVNSSDYSCHMPQYLFARYFDAEVFVVGSVKPEELERAQPFAYRPTLPAPEKKQLEMFVDNIPGGFGK